MSDKPDNPPAFAHTSVEYYGGEPSFTVTHGMTLRDYAAINMDNPLAGDDISESWVAEVSGLPRPAEKATYADKFRWWCEAEARMRYIKADAMLRARNNE